MSAYDDLIPGTSPSRRRSAYDDLLPGGAPATTGQPAEDASIGAEVAAAPGIAERARQVNQEIIANQPARATMSARGGARIEPADLSLKEPDEVTAPWTGEGGVLTNLPAGMVASGKNAIANVARMVATEKAQALGHEIETGKTPEQEAASMFARSAQRGRFFSQAPQDVELQPEPSRAPTLERVAELKAKLEEQRKVTDEADLKAAETRKEMELVTPKDMGTGQQAVWSLGVSAPPTAAGIAAGILTRNPFLAMAIAGGGGAVQQAGSTYGEARDEHGASHEVASKAALVDAVLEGAGEALPLKVALKPGTKAFKRMANTLIAEAGQEGATQVMQDLNAYLTYNPEITLKEAWQNLKVAALAGAGGGAVFGATGAAANLGKNKAPETRLQGEEEPAAPVEQTKVVQPPAPAVAPVQAPAANTPFNVDEAIAALPAEGPAPVKVPATPLDQATNVSELRTAARAYAKTTFVNTEVKNAETGFDIRFPGNGVKHATANANQDELAVVPVLPQLLAGARYLGEEADHVPNRPQIKAFHRFEGQAERAGAVMTVEMVVREMKSGKYFYDHTVTKKQTPDGISRDQKGRSPSQSAEPASGAEGSVDDDLGQDNLGAPASTTITAGTVPVPSQPIAAAGGTPSKQQTVGQGEARPDAIRKAMAELFGAPISEKHQGKKNLGIYRITPETIRLRNRNDLRTASHEVGHHISNRDKPFRTVMRQHAAELIAIMPLAYKQQIAKGKTMTKKLQIEEGFAEFIADYLTNPAQLQAKTPGFYKAFETWLGQNPTYSQALEHVQGMIGAHEALTPEQKILAKVGAYKPSLGARAKTLASKDTWNTVVYEALDKTDPYRRMVADLAPGLAASKNPHIAARLLPGDAAIIEDWVTDFTSPYDYQKRLDPKNYGMSLKKIMEPILSEGSLSGEQRQQELDRFKAYLIARRAAELKRAGKENLFTNEEIAAGLKLDTIQPGRSRLYEAVARGIYRYNDSLLDYAVEGGLLSKETAEKFRQYTAYIPFFREPEGDSKAGGGSGNPFKRLTGGTQNVRDPLANLIQNTANIIHATNRNAVVRKAVELAKAVPGGGRWIETVPVPMQAQQVATEQIVKELQKQGVKVDASMAQSLAAMQTFFTRKGQGDDRTRTIVYKDGGELKAAQINDALLWKAISGMPPLEMDLITKILAFPAQTLRAGVVLDPTFMVRNFARDTLSSTIQSKGTFLPVASTADGMKLMAQKADAYKLWRSFGGAFGDQFHEPEEAAAALERMAKRGNFSVGSIVSPMRLLDGLRKVGSYTESGSRIGEFKATYKPGDFESALTAAFNAREVSTDFGMRGGNTAIQIWTRLVPFMNPAMQGLYKTGRVLGGQDGREVQVKAAVIGTAMALASILLAMANSGEDWYERLEEWEKATYWHFKLGGEVWRIPKPFEYGMLFASLPEAIALRAAEREGDVAFKKRMQQVLSQVMIRAVPQTATLLAEPWANKSFFTGRKIVPDRQEKLEPGLQANPNTSKVAQVAGEATNISPAMIDNAVRNTFGTIGVHATTAADALLEQTGAFPPGREKTWRSWPAIKAFVHDPDNPNSRQQRDFYDDLEKYRRAVATVKELKDRGDEGKAVDYQAEKAEDLSMAKAAESAAKKLAKIRKQIRAIDWDRDMSPSEKREAINDKNAQAQDVVEEHQPLYQAAKKSYARPATEGAK